MEDIDTLQDVADFLHTLKDCVMLESTQDKIDQAIAAVLGVQLQLNQEIIVEIPDDTQSSN